MNRANSPSRPFAPAGTRRVRSRFRAFFPLGLLAASLASPLARAAAPDDSFLVYIGTYTGGRSEGIYRARFDAATGKLSSPELVAKTPNPSFLAVHPSGRWLYAAGEVSDFGPQHQGTVTAYGIARETGALTLLGRQPSGGGGPCHVAVDQTGRCALVANYGTGSIAALPIQADGSLGAPASVIQHHGSSVNPRRQEGPHAHCLTADPANRFALACDLGLDQVLVYRLDPLPAALVPNHPPAASVPAGAGPRHLAFHPNGAVAFVISELGSVLSVFAYDAEHGTLAERQTLSTLPPDFKGNSSCAEVQVHPTGKFVYGSNRGHDSIAVFAFDVAGNRLSPVEYAPTHGRTPRHFALDPTGRWLLAENQDSDNIVLFRVDQVTGRLTPTGDEIKVGAPVCLVFLKP